MWLRGVEFFDRSGCSQTRGSTTGNRKEIRLQEDKKVIGVKEFASAQGYLYDLKFKISRGSRYHFELIETIKYT